MKLKQSTYENAAIRAGLELKELSIHYQHNQKWIIWYKNIAETIELDYVNGYVVKHIAEEVFMPIFEYLYELSQILEEQ